MRRTQILIMMTALCLSTRWVSAQTPDLATNIDRSAAAAGLPAGDGTNSPAEVYLASLLNQEIDTFSNTVDTFEHASPQNSALMDSIEQTSGQYNQQAYDSAMGQTLTEVSNNLNQLITKLEAEAAGDPNAASIANGLADADAGDPLTAAESDAYAQQISKAFEDYNLERAATEAAQVKAIQDAFNEYNRERWAEEAAQVEAIQNAFNEYNRENAQKQGRELLTPSDQNFMVQSVINAINEYLNDSNVKRKETIKRRMKRLIEIMVPSQNLPINGYWRPLPYTTSISGSCLALNGDNDGPGSSGAPNENPGEPLCGYAPAGMTPFITWTDGSHPYLPGTSSMYGRAPQETFVSIQNGQGQTTGSTKVTTFTEYEVISPTQIRVHVFTQEAGGCTQNANYMLELVTPDDSVCKLPTAAATPEPVPTAAPPIKKAAYLVREPSLSEPAECDATNTPPQADEITLEQQADYSVKLEYGDVTHTLFPSGKDYFEYNSGRGVNLRESISLSISEDRTNGYFAWSINNLDRGKLCYFSTNIVLPGSEAAEEPLSGGEVEGQDSSESSDSDTGTVIALVPGDFTVTLDEFPGLTCPEALRSHVPAFENVTLSGSGAAFMLESDGVAYPLMQLPEQYMYTTNNTDNSMVYLGIFSREDDGSMTGLYSHSLEDGTSCIFQLAFVPVAK